MKVIESICPVYIDFSPAICWTNNVKTCCEHKEQTTRLTIRSICDTVGIKCLHFNLIRTNEIKYQ